MFQNNLRALRLGFLSLVTCAFVSCSSTMSSMGIPPALGEALGQVTGMTGKIADWKSGLGSMMDQTGLGQLKGFVDQAGDLGSKISGMTDSVSGAMADPMKAIGDQLGSMGDFDVSKLTSMLPNQQMDALEGFTGSASELGSMTEDFMKQFSK